MEIKEITEKLHKLIQNLNEQTQLNQKLQSLQNELKNKRTRPNVKLTNFDSTHKEKFINEKVGQKPIKPSKTLVIVAPVYIKKKKEYEEAMIQYRANVQAATKEYYSTFEDQRQNIIETYKKEREAEIQNYMISIDEIKEKLSFVNLQISNEDIVGTSIKNVSDIRLLIEIFDNKRATSITEAINILFEDKHHKKMEELQTEYIRLIKETKEAAETAAEYAAEATDIATRALHRADEAYDEAQKAYSACTEATGQY